MRFIAHAPTIAVLPLMMAAGWKSYDSAQDEGQRVYSQVCAGCHQAAGEGIPGAIPPLARSEWVNGNKPRLINIILHGVTGEITVAGEQYYETMPGFGVTLSDTQVAAVATYVRSAWGNTSDPVSSEEVTSARRAAAGRTEAWTVPELLLATVQEK